MAFRRLYCNLSASFSRLLLLSLALLGAKMAVAQSVSFSSASTTLASGFTDAPGSYPDAPLAIAADNFGNVYVADSAGNQVVKITPAGERSILSTGSFTLSQPQGIAVDAAGDIYISDSGNNRVVEVAASGAVTELKTGALSLAYPTGLAVDIAGNVYIDDSNNWRIVKAAPGGAATIVNTGSYTVEWGMGLAVDQSGTLYIADTTYDGNGETGRVLKVTADGHASEMQLTTSTGESLSLDGPEGVAVDQSGNVFIADTFDGHVVKVAPDGVASILSTGNEDIYDYPAVAASRNGILAILETPAYSGAGPDQVVIAQTESVNFGTANVCPAGQKSPSPCSRTLSLNYTSNDPISPGTSLAPTLGTPSADFTVAGPPACGSANNGYRCSQDVVFTPSAVGSRIGAFELTSSNGSVLGTMPVSGTGQGPMVAFLPGTASAISTGNQVLGGPSGIIFDDAGNRYVTDSVKNQALKITANGNASILNTGAYSLSQPEAIAMDGAGTIYIADTGNNRILEISTNGSSSILNTNTLTLSQPRALAIDGNGTLYIADTGNNRIVEAAADGYVSTLATGSLTLQQPCGVAVDAAGNIYIADTGNSRILKVAAVDGKASVAATGNLTLGQPTGLTVDAAGTLYISDAANRNVVAVAADGSASVLSLGAFTLAAPSGMALDTLGNLYIADAKSNHVIELNRSTAPALSFASTAVGADSGAQTVTLANIGNASLSFPVPETGSDPSISANFTLHDSSTCPRINSSAAASGSLAAGSSCTLDVSFTPASVGTVSGSLIVTDDALNALHPFAEQIIALQGTSNTEISSLSIGSSLNPSTYGQAVAITAVMGTKADSGTVTFYDGTAVLGNSAVSNGQAALTTSALHAGTHSITAHYAGNGVMEAATSNVLTQVVAQAAPVLTWAPPSVIANGASLSGVVNAKANISGSFSYTAQTSSGAVLPVTSSTVLQPGKYLLTASFTPSDAIDFKAATLTASLTVNTAVPAPSFTLSLNTTTLTLNPGQSGTVKAIFTPENGFKGTVTFSCTGLPELTNCSLSPKTLVANGSNTQQMANITVTAINPALGGFWFLPAGVLGGLLFWRGRKLQAASKYLWMIVLLSCTVGMMGCGVNFSAALPGSGTVTVTATANSGISQTRTFVLNVVRQ